MQDKAVEAAMRPVNYEIIFDVEDEIAERRDSMIDALQKRMAQRTRCETLFTIRWSVV